MSKEKERREKKFSLSLQAFLLFYAALIGLIAGITGNLWATLFFEYKIKGDVSLALNFWSFTLTLLGIGVVLIVAMIYFYNKTKELEKEKINRELGR